MYETGHIQEIDVVTHLLSLVVVFFFSSRRRHTIWNCDWSSDVCSSDLINPEPVNEYPLHHPFYDPLWAEIADLDVPLGVHVAAGTALNQVGMDYFPQWEIGRSICAFTVGNQVVTAAMRNTPP